MAREGRVHENGCGNNPWKDSSCSYISSSPSATCAAAPVTTRCISRRSVSRRVCCTRSSPRPITWWRLGCPPNKWACWGARAIFCRRSPSSPCWCFCSWSAMRTDSCCVAASASSRCTSSWVWAAVLRRSCSSPRPRSWERAPWRSASRSAAHCPRRSAPSPPSFSTCRGVPCSPFRLGPPFGRPAAFPSFLP